MSERKSLSIGLCVITTGKYKQFFQQLLDGVNKYFLPTHKINVFLFTDEYIGCESTDRVSVEQIFIPAYKFPFATLYRYKIFNEHRVHLRKENYIFYTDCDMSFVNTVSDEILGDGLTVVYHPGFYSQKNIVGHWGSNEVSEDSLAYVNPDKRIGYVAGGFNGATSFDFLKMSYILSKRIDADEALGVMATYHDESHLNWYVKKFPERIKYLDPSYCLVEQKHLREAWGISHLPERIIALSKDHKSIRE